VLAAGGDSSPHGEQALAWLCEAYWYPLYACARQQGATPHEAEDLVQGFFEQVFTRQIFGSARQERGSFRSYLKVSFDRFCVSERIKATRLKRGGYANTIPLDEAEAEQRYQRDLTDPRTPQRGFDHTWALTLLERVFERLRAEMEADGKGGRFVVLQRFLNGDRADCSVETAARQLSVSVAAARSIVFRMRERFRELVREEIRQTVSSAGDIVSELRVLYSALGG
jgi:DNA-directed RNA polymerase specialized sigma24 family protein